MNRRGVALSTNGRVGRGYNWPARARMQGMLGFRGVN